MYRVRRLLQDETRRLDQQLLVRGSAREQRHQTRLRGRQWRWSNDFWTVQGE